MCQIVVFVRVPSVSQIVVLVRVPSVSQIDLFRYLYLMTYKCKTATLRIVT